jgi:BirA family transcriptional regulator, biotin operon repressor / biotin---[acetyl-CoA-carboxylase] ligase
MRMMPAQLEAYGGVAVATLRAQCGASQLVAVAQCESTMDLAHDLAGAGAEHGTVVVAESQGAGRGRSGKSWLSAAGGGVWASVLLRTPAGDAPPGVLSLRVGLALAAALESGTPHPIQLKWPNDLLLERRKVAGVLTEARWRGTTLEWIVVGVGVNLTVPEGGTVSSALPPTARAGDVLVQVARAVMQAGQCAGALSGAEIAAYARRDVAVGRRVVEPLNGVVRGIDRSGGIVIDTADGEQVAVSGSLIFHSPLTD